MSKKDHPWAKCTKCGAFYSNDMIEKCSACSSPALADRRPNVWFECQVCNATGLQGDAPCCSCDGKGWLWADLFKM